MDFGTFRSIGHSHTRTAGGLASVAATGGVQSLLNLGAPQSSVPNSLPPLIQFLLLKKIRFLG